jgi:hypothetical protein
VPDTVRFSWTGSGDGLLRDGDGDKLLFGGAGNDVMRYHAGDAVDGGENLDFLLVDDGQTDIGDLLETGAVRNVEFIVRNWHETLSDLANMGDIITALNDAGLNVTGNGLVTGLGSEWSASYNADGGYYTFTDGTGSATVAVSEVHVDAALQTEIMKSGSGT